MKRMDSDYSILSIWIVIFPLLYRMDDIFHAIFHTIFHTIAISSGFVINSSCMENRMENGENVEIIYDDLP